MRAATVAWLILPRRRRRLQPDNSYVPHTEIRPLLFTPIFPFIALRPLKHEPAAARVEIA